MKLSVSDLAFPGFSHNALTQLPAEYGLELFIEFGTAQYWDTMIPQWMNNRTGLLSFHGNCVAINLADSKDTHWYSALKETIALAATHNASFVVLHTNEALTESIPLTQTLVRNRLRSIQQLAEEAKITVVIENVGLKIYGNVLFTYEEYLELLAEFPLAKVLIDTGHAHVNGWDIPHCIHTLKDRIIAYHIHDNDSTADAHLPIGQGTINWTGIFSAMQEYTPNAHCVLEYIPMQMPDLLLHIDEVKRKYGL